MIGEKASDMIKTDWSVIRKTKSPKGSRTKKMG